MKIKHMPNGLFPNEDSGFERKPLFPLAGQTVQLDCRLSDAPPNTQLRLHLSENGKPLAELQSSAPVFCKENHAFYSFSLVLPPTLTCIEYYFAGDDGKGNTTATGSYRLETMRELYLEEPESVQLGDRQIRAFYQVGDRAFCLHVELSEQAELCLEESTPAKVPPKKPVAGRSYPLGDSCSLRVAVAPFA
ncbi:MAG: hypothetical protein RR185_09895, partial [Angelakisella sp.]